MKYKCLIIFYLIYNYSGGVILYTYLVAMLNGIAGIATLVSSLNTLFTRTGTPTYSSYMKLIIV